MIERFLLWLVAKWVMRPMTKRRQWCINQRARFGAWWHMTFVARQWRVACHAMRARVATLLALLETMTDCRWRMRFTRRRDRSQFVLRKVAALGLVACVLAAPSIELRGGTMSASLLLLAGQGGLVPEAGEPPPEDPEFVRKPTGGIYDTPTAPAQLRTLYFDGEAGSNGNGTEGSPYNSLASVNAALQAGDRLYVKGNITGTTPFRPDNSGSSDNPIQVIVWPTFTATFNNGAGASEWCPINPASKSYFHFEGVTIDAPSGATSDRGVNLAGGTNWTFVNCTIESCGFVALGTDNVWLYDCTFQGTRGDVTQNAGDWFNFSNGSDNVRLFRVTVDGTAYHSAGLLGNVTSGASDIFDPHVFDSYFRNPAAGGLQLLGYCNDAIVEWSVFEDMGTTATTEYSVGSKDGLQIAAPGTTFRFNRVLNGASKGILATTYTFGGKLQRSCNGHYHNNTLTGTTGVGFYLHAGTDVDAETDLTGNVVESNIIWKNNQGSATEGNGYFGGHWYPIWVNLYGTTTPWDIGSLGGNTIRNNLAARATDDTRFIMVSKNVTYSADGNQGYTVATFQSTFPSNAAGNIMATDPLLVDDTGTTAADHHLQEASPCIDAGYATIGVDYLGDGVDLGVFEYGGGD